MRDQDYNLTAEGISSIFKVYFWFSQVRFVVAAAFASFLLSNSLFVSKTNVMV